MTPAASISCKCFSSSFSNPFRTRRIRSFVGVVLGSTGMQWIELWMCPNPAHVLQIHRRTRSIGTWVILVVPAIVPHVIVHRGQPNVVGEVCSCGLRLTNELSLYLGAENPVVFPFWLSLW
jgi:hypothetical protein